MFASPTLFRKKLKYGEIRRRWKMRKILSVVKGRNNMGVLSL
jgi:hypothetical protein